jgi:predicted RNA binding protein YcfA (HicA-like mRNA interferase family)
VKVKAVIKQLRKDGWEQVRMKGSHRQFHHPHKRGTVTVAGKLNLEVPSGTLKNIQKQASLK